MTPDADKNQLFSVAEAKLRDRLAAATPRRPHDESWTDNLFSLVDTERVKAAYSSDPDWQQDLTPAHSSAAMAANLFLPWSREITRLTLGSLRGLESFQLEVSRPTGTGGTPAFFDALANTREHSIGIEIKCLEYLADPPQKYLDGYRSSIAEICTTYGRSETGWLGVAHRLQAEFAGYRILFAAQLVKQAIALLHGSPATQQILLYLFWEPLDWPKYDCFELHRSELANLQNEVLGDRVQLIHMSVHELLQDWRSQVHSQPEWFQGYVAELERRYELSLGDE